jgi:hypothetical protein
MHSPPFLVSCHLEPLIIRSTPVRPLPTVALAPPQPKLRLIQHMSVVVRSTPALLFQNENNGFLDGPTNSDDYGVAACDEQTGRCTLSCNTEYDDKLIQMGRS